MTISKEQHMITEKEILKNEIRELQSSLQKAYKRIAELTGSNEDAGLELLGDYTGQGAFKSRKAQVFLDGVNHLVVTINDAAIIDEITIRGRDASYAHNLARNYVKGDI